MEVNIRFDLILQEFKCYKVTMDNINSFKKMKHKTNLQRFQANNVSLANPLIIKKSIYNWLYFYVQNDWPENSLH